MCGICGVIGGPPSDADALVATMNRQQRHRGPDHESIVRSGRATLGTTRLAIQDPTPSGNQPFVSADGRYTCVFNGEIYNDRELTQRFGLRPTGGCDGAVIPELLSHEGLRALRHLQGMYAIAIVDRDTNNVLLARDPFGIKPLYWMHAGDAIVFASDLKALVAVGGSREIDEHALARYLYLGSFAPDATPLRGINAVAPNSVVVIDADPPARSEPILGGSEPLLTAGETDDLGASFTETVDRHMRSDVPVALLLSGGSDSSAIAAAAANRSSLTCVTLRGLGSDDEVDAAGRTARLYGHDLKIADHEMGEADVGSFFHHMQRPSIDGLNTFLVSRAIAAAGFKVALTGLGGDEALSGYGVARVLRRLSWLRAADRLPRPIRHGLAAAAGAATRRNEAKIRRLVRDHAVRDPWALELLQREIFPAPTAARLVGVAPPSMLSAPIDAGPTDDPRTALARAQTELYLQSMLLPDADAFSMAWSVELRVPYVSIPFFGRAVASSAKADGKRLLADALDDDHLRGIARRPKRGFVVPMQAWIGDGPLRPSVQAALDPDAAVWRVVDRDAALDAANDAGWPRVWALAALNAWLGSLPSPVEPVRPESTVAR